MLINSVTDRGNGDAEILVASEERRDPDVVCMETAKVAGDVGYSETAGACNHRKIQHNDST